MNATAVTIGEMIRNPASQPWRPPGWLNRLARIPAIGRTAKAASAVLQADADMQETLTNPGHQAALALLGHPAARSIVIENDLVYGQAPVTSPGQLYDDLITPGAYGIQIDNAERLDALSDVLSHAAGRPIDAASVTPDEAQAILDDYWAVYREEESDEADAGVTEGNVRVVGQAEEIDCFNVPEGVDPEEFKRQLKEQQDAINDTDIDTLQARRQTFRNGNAKRDRSAQRDARRAWIRRRTRTLQRTQGLSRADARIMASKEALLKDATHIIDMVAGGDPSAISGLGNSSINRSIGSQWRGRRVRQLDGKLAEQKGEGKTKPEIELEVCD